VNAPEESLRHVGRARDIPHLEGRRVTVDGVAVAIFSTERGFAALAAVCPHNGGPLADGIVSERCVTCPLHNWRIDLHSGEVVAGGEGAVAVYELVEREGELYLRVSEDGAPVLSGGEPLQALA
jgi:nitrite reductase (NADH) small subunit